MVNESDNRRGTSRELFVSMRLRCCMRVRDGLATMDPHAVPLPL